jgi:two-component system, NtrC family, sensor kinase
MPRPPGPGNLKGQAAMEDTHPLKNKYYRALSRNIVFVILVASISPMVIASIFIMDDFRTAYRQKVYDHLELMAWNHRKSINLFLKEKLANIRLLGNQFDLERFSNKSFLEQKLSQLQQSYDRVFVDLGLINSEGIQVSYAGPHALTNANYAQAEWFKRAIASPYFTSDVFSGLRGTPHFIVSVRCFAQGRYWLLRATIDFGSFNSLVENLRIGQTGFVFIFNKAGEFQTKPVATTEVPTDILQLFSTQAKGRSSWVITRRAPSGKVIIYASIYLKDDEWIMVLQQDLKDAFAELYKTQKIANIIILVGSMIIISTSLLLSRMLITRIAKADREKKLADQEKEMMSQQVIETGKLASIGELAAGIAHEINNPVAIMVEEAGWIQDLLEEEEFKESDNLKEFHRALRQINTQGRRCKDITHKLLSFARKTDSRVQELAINELLSEVVYLSGQRAKFSNIAIHTRFQEDLPVLQASETELQQVLLNMVNNALDAMEKSGGELAVVSSLENGQVVISLSDNGPGIAEANLARIFDPFFTTKPVGKGTGLGLSICYGIINKMGGRIDVQSQVDKGTTFTIRLPAN